MVLCRICLTACWLQSLFVLHGLHAKDAIPNKQGRLAIHIAAATGFRDGVQYLLRNMAANIDARDADGRTPLMLAIANNQVDVIKVLVARGADVVGARTTEGMCGRCRCSPLAHTSSAELCTDAVNLHTHPAI